MTSENPPSPSPTPGPLSGVRVLDLSQFLSGPRCTQILADLGAEVIKVEPPQGETMRLFTMLMPGMERNLSVLNRNKKGITLNLKHPKGKDLFRRLAEKVDVVVENFTPGTMEGLGLGFPSLRERNPRLIYAVVAGFGQTGPLSFRPAFDIIAQATGGIMAALEQPDRPPRVFFGDLVSGAYMAIGVLVALLARGETGRGQLVDISMQDVMYAHNWRAITKRAIQPVWGEVQKTLGRDPTLLKEEDRRMPFWNTFKAKDGYIAIVSLTDDQWKRMMEVIGRPELKDDERYGNLVARVRNPKEVMKIVEDWAVSKNVAEIEALCDKARIPCGRVHDIDGVNADPQLESRGMFARVDHPTMGAIDVPGNPIRLSETSGNVSTAAPDLGQHTDEVLSSLLGMGREEVEELRRDNAV